MGCDIHTYIEVRTKDKWRHVKYPEHPEFTRSVYMPDTLTESIWYWRNYRAFAVLANVRNYSNVQPLSKPRGTPPDCSPTVAEEMTCVDFHSNSYFLLTELLTANWDAELTTRDSERMTYRQFVGSDFMDDIEILRRWAESKDIDPEDVRIVFAFDN